MSTSDTSDDDSDDWFDTKESETEEDAFKANEMYFARMGGDSTASTSKYEEPEEIDLPSRFDTTAKASTPPKKSPQNITERHRLGPVRNRALIQGPLNLYSGHPNSAAGPSGARPSPNRGAVHYYLDHYGNYIPSNPGYQEVGPEYWNQYYDPVYYGWNASTEQYYQDNMDYSYTPQYVPHSSNRRNSPPTKKKPDRVEAPAESLKPEIRDGKTRNMWSLLGYRIIETKRKLQVSMSPIPKDVRFTELSAEKSSELSFILKLLKSPTRIRQIRRKPKQLLELRSLLIRIYEEIDVEALLADTILRRAPPTETELGEIVD